MFPEPPGCCGKCKACNVSKLLMAKVEPEHCSSTVAHMAWLKRTELGEHKRQEDPIHRKSEPLDRMQKPVGKVGKFKPTFWDGAWLLDVHYPLPPVYVHEIF